MEKKQTVRKEIIELLRNKRMSAKAISITFLIKEREVVEHLEHIQKSLKHNNEKLMTDPAMCLECSHIFRDRTKISRPFRCPKCNSERITPPLHYIVSTN